MAVFFPEGIDGNAVYIPCMTFEFMDMQLQPYIRYIVSKLYICDDNYSVWLYNVFTRKSEFLEGSIRIPFTEETKAVSFSINDIDYYVFCVNDANLKNRIISLLSFVYQCDDEVMYHEKK